MSAPDPWAVRTDQISKPNMLQTIMTNANCNEWLLSCLRVQTAVQCVKSYLER
jgi:hypothetical protein